MFREILNDALIQDYKQQHYTICDTIQNEDNVRHECIWDVTNN